MKNMISLTESDIKNFKKNIYKEYKKLFPPLERKSFNTIKSIYLSGNSSLIEIKNDNTLVGFFILNIINNYIQIDYFAIFSEFQGNGFGTSALKLLLEKYSTSDGIFIEIEKVNNGKNEKENLIREKRYNFYKKIGFTPLNFDLLLYKVLYTPCCFNYIETNNLEKTKDILFNFYYLGHSKKEIDRFCKVIE